MSLQELNPAASCQHCLVVRSAGQSFLNHIFSSKQTSRLRKGCALSAAFLANGTVSGAGDTQFERTPLGIGTRNELIDRRLAPRLHEPNTRRKDNNGSCRVRPCIAEGAAWAPCQSICERSSPLANNGHEIACLAALGSCRDKSLR